MYTQEELKIWKERLNHPGWHRIQNKVKEFVSNPEGDRWTGYWTGNSPIPQGDQYAPEKKIEGLFVTAFASIITGNHRDICLKELGWYVDNQYLDASNKTRFSRTNIFPPTNVNDGSPGFDMAAGYTKLFLTYLYLKDQITDHSKYERFFVNAADYFYDLNNYGFHGIFENGGIKDKAYYSQEGAITHDNGYKTERIGRYYNNRRGDYVRCFAFIGLYYDIEKYKNAAKEHFQNWIKYSIYPDGTGVEMYRGGSDKEEQGWQYSAITVNQMIEIADAFARYGDMSLYEFTTSEGIGKTSGGPKSLKLAIYGLLNYIDGTWKRTVGGKLIDGYSEAHKRHYVCQTWFSQSNMYYKDDRIKKAYENAPTSSIMGVGGEDPYVGNSHTCPDKMFMYEGMENIWPYDQREDPKPDEPTEEDILISEHNEIKEAYQKAINELSKQGKSSFSIDREGRIQLRKDSQGYYLILKERIK